MMLINEGDIMKKIIIICSLLILVMIVAGCEFSPIDYVPFMGSSSGSRSSQSNQQQTSTSNTNQNNQLPSAPCEPHGTFNGISCNCDPGYIAQGLDCVAGNRECTYDKDCGTNGCQGDYKVVYRCDLRTYKCIPSKGTPAEKVNCKTEYGKEYICLGGQCIFDPTPPFQK